MVPGAKPRTARKRTVDHRTHFDTCRVDASAGACEVLGLGLEKPVPTAFVRSSARSLAQEERAECTRLVNVREGFAKVLVAH